MDVASGRRPDRRGASRIRNRRGTSRIRNHRGTLLVRPYTGASLIRNKRTSHGCEEDVRPLSRPRTARGQVTRYCVWGSPSRHIEIGQVQNSLHRTVEYAPPSPLIRSPQSVRIDQVMRYCVWMFGKDLPWMRERRGVRPRSRPHTALRR